MNKIKLFLITSILVVGFQQVKAQSNDSIPSNQLHYDTAGMDTVLYGNCTVDFIRTNTYFGEMFDFYYNDHAVALDIITPYANQLNMLEITIVMGSWCGDSQEQVPRFLKIMDELGYPPHLIKIICVDHQKEAKGIDVSSLNIKLVPTFIFTKDGEEVGRIIETPELSLEEDLALILKQVD